MDQYTLVIGLKIRFLAMGFISGWMVGALRVNGIIIVCMDRDHIHGPTDVNM